MKQSFVDKVTEILKEVAIVRNLARKKFIGQFLFGLVKSGSVHFVKVAEHLNDNAKVKCNEVRIQDFFREVTLDYRLVSILILSLLPQGAKLRVCIDRTEWDFGSYQANILMVTLGYGNIAIPVCWELLDNKSGNSSAESRKALVDRLLAVLPANRIGVLIADREFIGVEWLRYLKSNGIRFLVRMPKHHWVHKSNGESLKVPEMNLPKGKAMVFSECLIDGVLGNVWVKRLADGDFLFLFGTVKAPIMGQIYRKRWTIESCFQNMKGRGFNLGDSHLKNSGKLKKLVAMASLAYALCLNLGMYVHERVEAIKTKNHGYKANSFARKGMDAIKEWTRENYPTPDFVPYLIELASRYIRRKIYLIKMVG